MMRCGTCGASSTCFNCHEQLQNANKPRGPRVGALRGPDVDDLLDAFAARTRNSFVGEPNLPRCTCGNEMGRISGGDWFCLVCPDFAPVPTAEQPASSHPFLARKLQHGKASPLSRLMFETIDNECERALTVNTTPTGRIELAIWADPDQCVGRIALTKEQLTELLECIA